MRVYFPAIKKEIKANLLTMLEKAKIYWMLEEEIDYCDLSFV